MENDVQYFFQLISAEDGSRSQPVATTPKQLRDYLNDNPPDHDCYVLLIGRCHVDDNMTLQDAFSSFPLVSTQTFCYHVGRMLGEIDPPDIEDVAS